MKLKTFVAVVAVLTACTPATKEETADSTSVATDTMVVVDTDPEVISDYEAQYDSVIEQVAVETAFTSPQISPTIAYVYYVSGLTVYASADANKSDDPRTLGTADFKSKLELTQPLVNNTASDQMVMDGLRGRLVEIKWNGQHGYVFSGYLLNYPVPDQPNLFEYMKANFQMTSHTEIKRGLHVKEPPKGNEFDDSQTTESIYNFEGGVVFRNTGYYEGGSDMIEFPAATSLQELYLLANAFFEDYRNMVSGFPKKAFESKKSEEVSVKAVADDNGNIISISIESGEGCYNETTITADGKQSKILSGGGC